MKGEYGWVAKSGKEVCAYLNTFYHRKYLIPPDSEPYPVTVTNTAEYQKIHKYLTEVDAKAGCGYGTGTTPTPASSNTLCGKAGTKTGFTQPGGWDKFVCREKEATEFVTCYSYDKYTNNDKTKGCPSKQQCCPPKPGTGSGSSEVGQKCGDPSATFKFGINPTGYTGSEKPAKWDQYICRLASTFPDAPGKDGKFDFNKMCFADLGNYKVNNPSFKCPDMMVCCPPGTS